MTIQLADGSQEGGTKSAASAFVAVLVVALFVGLFFALFASSAVAVSKSLKAETEALHQSSRGQPWRECVKSLSGGLKPAIGVSQLEATPTKYGMRYTLLVKRKEVVHNDLFQCEVSAEGEFIVGRYGSR